MSEGELPDGLLGASVAVELSGSGTLGAQVSRSTQWGWSEYNY